MSETQQAPTVGSLPASNNEPSRVPVLLTRLVWTLFLASLGVLVAVLVRGPWELSGVVAVDGLTVTMWLTVTFFSAIVHSYSRRYMAGSRTIDGFFWRVFAFTLVVMGLVAADHLLVFGAGWLVMGLVMTSLIGHIENWPQAQAAATLARRYFLASSAALAAGLGVLWSATGSTTISGLAAVDPSTPVVLFAAGALLLAAMIQSALLPFHTWLLSSMTAPTPASALMHAGFVNAGGVLLVRFAPVVTIEPAVMFVIVLVGAASALAGKLLKTVQPDVKGTLACSTTGQMGFMIMQAGLGFFAAAITHLILHGFYKAYQFLGAGAQVDQQSPSKSAATRSSGPIELFVIAGTALAGGVVFALLTGKGTALDSGLVLTLLVVLTVLHAAREIVTQGTLPAAARYGGVPLVALPAIAVYAAVYRGVASLLADLPAVGYTAELTVVHGLVGVAFLLAYLAIESGIYQRSTRLYVALLNATEPAPDTQLTATEEYNEY